MLKQNSKKVLIWTIVMIILAGAGLTGCSKSISVIELPAFFSKRKIEIKLPVTRYDLQADPFEFESEKTLEQISEAVLKWDSGAGISIHENGMLISSKNPDTQKWDYYYIYKISPSGNGVYRICDLRIRYIDKTAEQEDNYLEFLFPMHLLRIEDYGGDLIFNSGERYEMVPDAAIEDVYYFYSTTGYYEAEWDKEQIILRRTYLDNIEETDEDRSCYEIQTPVIITITTEDEKHYLSYTVEEVPNTDTYAEDGREEMDLFEEERPVISWEAALEQTLLIAGKNSEEIESREILFDMRGNPCYEMLTFSSGGYAIHMLRYAVVIEFSVTDERQYPFQGAEGKKKYYTGPGNDFYEDNGRIMTCQQNSEVRLEDFQEEEELIVNYAKRMGDRIAENEGGYDNLHVDNIDESNEPGEEAAGP